MPRVEEVVIRPIPESVTRAAAIQINVIYEFKPPVLEHGGLVGALQIIDAVEKRVGIKVRLIMEDFLELSVLIWEKVAAMGENRL